MKRKKKTALFLIILLAFFLRFNRLGKNPPSLNLDEVAIGYNAYSILKTGRDEYGQKFPLAFRSHDDYKPPLYIYLSVPSVALFGLNEFAVRFPSALLGSVTVFITFLLTWELFALEKKKEDAENLGLISALVLAISPWHLQFSRAGYETNVAVFFISLGLWAFLRAMKGAKKFWYLSAVSVALAMYTYQAARLFIPLFGLVLIMTFGKSLAAKAKQAVVPTILFLFLITPLVPVITSEAGLMRFKGTSVFEHPGLIEEEAERALLDASRRDVVGTKLFHNRRLSAVLTVFEGYLEHFRPDFLFLGNWGPPVNYAPQVGLLYFIELPLIIWGVHKTLNFKDRKSKAMIFSWIALSPLASSLTYDVPSSVRMTIIIPALQMLAAVGILGWLSASRREGRTRERIMIFLLVSVYGLSFARYIHQYHVHAPVEFAEAWQYGYKEAVEFAEQHKDEYDRIIVSTNLRQPQNFFAFYSSYDPSTYIFVDGGTVSGGFLESKNKFGKYEFHPINYDGKETGEKTLLIDLYDRMPLEYRKVAEKIIWLPDGEPTIAISQRQQ